MFFPVQHNTNCPEFVSEDIQYVIINSDRKCSFTINSDTLIDVCQLRISCGDEVLYECTRSNPEHTISESISKLSYNKTGNTYVLSFTLDKNYSVDKLNGRRLRKGCGNCLKVKIKRNVGLRCVNLSRRGGHMSLGHCDNSAVGRSAADRF